MIDTIYFPRIGGMWYRDKPHPYIHVVIHARDYLTKLLSTLNMRQ